MIPTAKKSGSTVLGVRIGLFQHMSAFTLHDAQTPQHSLPCLQPLLPERGVYTNCISITCPSQSTLPSADVLAGRLDLSFFFFSLFGAWLSIESVCWICSVSVCDMMGESVDRRSSCVCGGGKGLK
jgi:hypothetical protein